MARLNEQRLDIARSVSAKLAKEGELTPFQARSFVRCLQTSWEVDVIQWREGESSKQLSHAYNLIHVAEIFREIEGENSSDAFQSYKRAAELLEWLSRSGDELNINVSVSLLAGAAYQLGGLPAMSSGLLKQVTFDGDGWKLCSQFLQGDFDGVISSAAEFWLGELELTEKDATFNLLHENEDDAFSWYIAVELVRTVGLISYSLRVDNKERLNVGLEKLDAMRRMGNKVLGSDISLLISMLSEVALNFSRASIYNAVERLSDIAPEKIDTLRRLARTQYHNGRGILWVSQVAGVERLIKQSSFALCTPTGSGKTLVANLALIKELLLVDNAPELGPLAIYLVPSRALAGEVERKLTREMGSEFIVTGLYGGNDWGITDYWLEAKRPTVLIATVEKAEALMRYLGPLIVARLKLLIIDEAHQVVSADPEYSVKKFAKHEDRSLRLESFVSRILVQLPDVARIALTAVAGGAAGPVSRWIELNNDAQPVGLNYRSTRQVIGVLETRSGSAPKINIDLMNGAPLAVVGRRASPYLNLKIDPMPQLPAAMRNSLNRYNQLEIFWTSMHFRQSGKRVLISLTQAPQKTMKWFYEALTLPGWGELVEFAPPENPNYQQYFNETLATCIDYCGEGSYETKLLEVGVATSHGQMPQRLRLLMTNLIERGICAITVATATLTEGVNLPFDIIFLPQLRRQSYDPDKEETVVFPLSTSEFINLSGRAGRPGAAKSMEGVTLIAIPQTPSTTAAGLKKVQQKQRLSLKSDYSKLNKKLVAKEDAINVSSPLSLLMNSIFDKALDQGLVSNQEEYLAWLERCSPGDVSDHAAMRDESSLAMLADSLDELDGILLNATEELSVIDQDDIESSDVEEYLKALWGKTFSTYAAAQEKWMERAFIKRGMAVVETVYPDKEERKRLYQYGFTPFMGRRFEAVFDDIKEVLISAEEYGVLTDNERFELFFELAEVISHDQGFGFSVSNSVAAQNVLDNWNGVLDWWLNFPEAVSPGPDELREWQRFVTENLEFRLGVAVGASVARAWSDGVNGDLVVPSLEDWKETTGLPWFGFWVRELLRWGTHEPFVAFSLAQGLTKTRSTALELKVEFDEWLENELEEIDPDDWISPQYFLHWKESISKVKKRRKKVIKFPAELTGTDGARGEYYVLPLYNGGIVTWLDPAGYELARSRVNDWDERYSLQNFDFKMTVAEGFAEVEKIF
ncbi:DNA helicase [Shewanella sp. GutCb]|uniref:DEAD/DEAH box helicase n=1 Tax=Shewanella sp. GutCb TaxID=2058315 RepID=UPI000C7D6BFC|nr:DEAD/DEAH box helicase [Shewanella sp. GutCb]PKG74832.1 DNA helicase [Shewanella sp. GutCb]